MRALICVALALVALCGSWECVEAFAGFGRHAVRSLSLSDSAYDALEQKLLKNSKVEAPKPLKVKPAVKAAPAPLKAATLPPKAVTVPPKSAKPAPKAVVDAPKPSFEFPSFKGAAASSSITPAETAAGVALGALPWLVAPLLAASALRGVLDKTKSSRVSPSKSTEAVVPDLATGAQQGIQEALTSTDAESELTRKGLLAVAATLTAGLVLLGVELNTFSAKPNVEPVAVKVSPKTAPAPAPKAVEKVVPSPVLEKLKAIEKAVAPPVVEAPKVIEAPKVEAPKIVEKPVEVAPAPKVEAPKPLVEAPLMEAIKPAAPSPTDDKGKKLQADTVSPELLNALKNRKTVAK